MKAVIALARTFKIAEAANAPRPQELRRWRGIRLGNLNLLVSYDSSGELLEQARICPLPHAQRWCRGLLNLRGRILPAFDLHDYFGLSRPSKFWWLVLGADDEALAFPIDALPQSLQGSEATRVEPAALPESLRAFVTAAHRIDGVLWLEFSHREFFRSLALRAAA